MEKITIRTTINATIDKVWNKWNTPGDIKKWNSPSPDWHTTESENDLKAGGKFSARMEAKDGSIGFDFWGIYDVIKTNEFIEYTIGDGRKVTVSFEEDNDVTTIIETFEAESENPVELQKNGWQAILDNFKKYTEEN